jgi:hypothetical protein
MNFINPDLPVIYKAKSKLDRLYRKHGNFRGVTKARGFLNVDATVKYVWEFMKYHIVPKNPAIRVKLFLPRVMPSERIHKKRRAIPKLGSNNWEKSFFKNPKPNKFQKRYL